MGIGRDTEANQTVLSEEFLMTCGVNYCPESPASDTPSSDNSTSESVTEGNFKTTTTQIYTLAGVYLACSLISPLVISALVNPLTRYLEAKEVSIQFLGIEYSAYDWKAVGSIPVHWLIEVVSKPCHAGLLLVPGHLLAA